MAIVDYGMGNIDSVARAVEECGGDPVVTDRKKDLADARAVILPGVGSFSMGMKNIQARGLGDLLRTHVLEKGVPFLGICLGMQLLAEKGTEGGETAGLGWIAGDVVRLTPGQGERIPHVGWNVVDSVQENDLLKGILPKKDFYFVHSYHFICRDPSFVLGRTPFAGGFVSLVGRGATFGVQFHPEKSQTAGFQLLRNFLAL